MWYTYHTLTHSLKHSFKQGHITLYIDRGAITAEFAHLPHTEMTKQNRPTLSVTRLFN
jgi:hypothetical protein